MNRIETIDEVRAVCYSVRQAGQRVGFVPTMGYFHAGHLSLMETARAANDLVVVSNFVNPTQFGPTEDLAAYPRDLDRDSELAAGVGVDVLFVPTTQEMYPAGAPRTTVHVAGLTEAMCGAVRPDHFDGVTTVVAKLFSIVGPCRAYFGRKDFQQLAVIQRMAADLDLPVEVVGVAVVREPDGLAMSSRNAYLSPAERAAAPALHAGLLEAVDSIRSGERNPRAVVGSVETRVRTEPHLTLEYVEVRDAENLAEMERLSGRFVVALAARAGRARLIDNVVVTVDGDGVTADVGVRTKPAS